jgi:hypothetical protein
MTMLFRKQQLGVMPKHGFGIQEFRWVDHAAASKLVDPKSELWGDDPFFT